MNKFYLLTLLIFTSIFISAQEVEEEVDPNIERVEKFKILLIELKKIEKNFQKLMQLELILL